MGNEIMIYFLQKIEFAAFNLHLKMVTGKCKHGCKCTDYLEYYNLKTNKQLNDKVFTCSYNHYGVCREIPYQRIYCKYGPDHLTKNPDCKFNHSKNKYDAKKVISNKYEKPAPNKETSNIMDLFSPQFSFRNLLPR